MVGYSMKGMVAQASPASLRFAGAFTANHRGVARRRSWMVAQARVELATPASSGQRSTDELPGHLAQHILCARGAVAQLIERRIRIAEVRGLNPLSSTTVFQAVG